MIPYIHQTNVVSIKVPTIDNMHNRVTSETNRENICMGFMHTVSSHRAYAKEIGVQLVLEGQRLKILEGGNLQINLLFLSFIPTLVGEIYSWKCQARAFRYSDLFASRVLLYQLPTSTEQWQLLHCEKCRATMCIKNGFAMNSGDKSSSSDSLSI